VITSKKERFRNIMNTTIRYKGTSILMIVVAGIIFLGSLMGCVNGDNAGIDFFNRSTFTTEKWLNDFENRGYILNDFLTNYELVGMAKSSVIELLGEADKTDENTMIFFVGTKRHFITFDDEWLYVKYNQDEIVIDTEIRED